MLAPNISIGGGVTGLDKRYYDLLEDLDHSRVSVPSLHIRH